MALGLAAPWLVERCTFDVAHRQLDLYLDFTKGGTFACPDCDQADCKAYDTQDKARGYRSTRYLVAMIYLIAGKLRFSLPT